MNELRMHIDSLSALLGGYAYRYGSEEALHDRLATVLTDAGWAFERERRADAQNRFDFFLPATGIVIEVKVDGTASQAARQCVRYLGLDDVRGLLLASTKEWADRTLRAEIRKVGWHGKPFGMVRLRRQAL